LMAAAGYAVLAAATQVVRRSGGGAMPAGG